MDLFHAVTQEIENVISCHWLDEFRASSRSHYASRSNTPKGTRGQSITPERSRRDSTGSDSGGSAVLSRASSISEIEHDKATMSSNSKTMDIEPGGETPQYESIKTVTVPHSKERGQLGGDVPGSSTDTSAVDAGQGQKHAEDTTYRQNILESDMGGKTNTVSGTAHQEGGLGGTEAQKELEGGKNPRTSQQYHVGRNVHDYNVGA